MNTAELDSYLASRKHLGCSIFAPFAKDILYMRNTGIATLKDIIDWLAQEPRNVKGDFRELSKWLKRQEKRALNIAKSKQAGTTELFENQAPTPKLTPAPRLPSATATLDTLSVPPTPAQVPVNDLVRNSQRDRDDSKDTPLARVFDDIARAAERGTSLELPRRTKASAADPISPTKVIE